MPAALPTGKATILNGFDVDHAVGPIDADRAPRTRGQREAQVAKLLLLHKESVDGTATKDRFSGIDFSGLSGVLKITADGGDRVFYVNRVRWDAMRDGGFGASCEDL
jgi:hypothetical protein